MPADNNQCCTQDFKVNDIVRCVSYNADKSQATVMKQGVVKRTNILGIEDSCQVLFDGETVAEAFFDEDKCACLQKKLMITNGLVSDQLPTIPQVKNNKLIFT